MVTIKEIAKRAGVSVGTTSKVLNYNETVSEINKKKVIRIIKGASDILISKGYYVHLCSSDNNPAKEDLYINDLKSMWADGIIIAPSDTENRNISIFNTIISPFVVVDREIEGLNKDKGFRVS